MTWLTKKEETRRNILDISLVKRFAYEKLPANSLLRNLILSEKQQLTSEEYVAKMDLWLKIITLEVKNK